MEETYKKHIIRSGAASIPNSNEWKPIVQINWNEGGKERVKLWMEWHFKRSSATYKEAEMEAHRFAKKWIDDAKHNLETLKML
jgi:hypothetical protein